MAKNEIKLKVSADDKRVAYLSLSDHPGEGVPGVVKKQVRLKDLYPAYHGADLYFDLDEDNRLIGIEILS